METLIAVLPVLITGVLVPFAIAALKARWPKIPRRYLPVIATVAPTVLELVLTALDAGLLGGPLYAALAGAIGIGIREVYDQAVRPHLPIRQPPLVLAWLAPALLAIALLGGCGSKPLLTDAKTPEAQAIEAIAQAERVLLLAWPALDAQIDAGLFTRDELRAFRDDLVRAGAQLDRAHALVKSGVLADYRGALSAALSSEKLIAAVQRRLAERINHRRLPR